jgi:asparagine synthase (glutamine-hydrolysing)
MCGILGGISIDPFDGLDDPERLRRAVDRLSHRGPDDRGQFIAADRRSFLAHRRLSIIDLAGGRQPIASESGRRHLCYNGEIYNFRSLQPVVTARGHRLATGADGEPALHLYEDDPEAFVVELQGMFALAVLDEDRARLTLVRDRNGIKPLFYFCDGRSLVFASELKAVLALLPRRPPLAPAALRQYLRWKYIPAPMTIYENIYKLPPAHLLSAWPDPAAGRLQVTLRRYWDLDYGGDKLDDEAVAVEQLDALLRSAVRGHLESDVEVGALLSGGVDSSLVVALASLLSGRRIKTFSVGFEEAGFDGPWPAGTAPSTSRSVSAWTR